MAKHEFSTSINPDFYVITGSSKYKMYQVGEKKIKTVSYTGGFAFIKVFNELNNNIKPLEQPPHQINNTKFDFGFRYLYKMKVQTNDKIIKYDIVKAYKTILSVFWLNFDKKTVDYFKKLKKIDFNKAVGYTAYSKQVINAHNGEIVEQKEPQRPDILFFCTTFLKELKIYLSKIYNDTLSFVYVDSFGFNEDIDFVEFQKICVSFQKKFYTEHNLDVNTLKYNKLDWHIDKYNVKKTGSMIEFFNDKETKKYFSEK